MKVVPGASSDAVVGWLDTTLKVRVSAPPEKGKANKSVEKLVAKMLKIPTSQVHVASGKASQYKQIEINGLTRDEIQRRLSF